MQIQGIDNPSPTHLKNLSIFQIVPNTRPVDRLGQMRAKRRYRVQKVIHNQCNENLLRRNYFQNLETSNQAYFTYLDGHNVLFIFRAISFSNTYSHKSLHYFLYFTLDLGLQHVYANPCHGRYHMYLPMPVLHTYPV